MTRVVKDSSFRREIFKHVATPPLMELAALVLLVFHGGLKFFPISETRILAFTALWFFAGVALGKSKKTQRI